MNFENHFLNFARQIKHHFFPPILNWIDEIETKSRKEKDIIHKIQNTPLQKDSLKIAFFTAVPWERGVVDFLLELGMKSRGHQTFHTHCSGGFSFCAMQTMRMKKPDCEYCSNRSHKIQSALQLEGAIELSDLINEEEREKAAELAKGITPDNADDFHFMGIPVGKITLRDVPQYFFYLPENDDPKLLEIWPSLIESAILYTIVSENFINKVKPDRAVVTSGKTISYAYFYELCRIKDIPVVTWDESAFSRSHFTFCWNGYSTEYKGEGDWEKEKEIELDSKSMSILNEYFDNAIRGKIGFHKLYEESASEQLQEGVKKDLGLVNDEYILMMTNVVWDTATLGLDLEFKNMLDWVFKTIDYLWDKTDRDLVIRVHPAETSIPDEWKTEITLDKYIKERYETLPDHIHLVQGPEAVSSHILAQYSSINMVYATSAGLDLSIAGYRVMVCGWVHYRGRGFTHDMESLETYYEYLDGRRQFDSKLSQEEIDIAYRYAKYFLYDSQVGIDEFECETRQEVNFLSFKRFLPLADGGDAIIDNLCEAIIEQKPFFKMGEG